jgi:hypothetical protein
MFGPKSNLILTGVLALVLAIALYPAARAGDVFQSPFGSVLKAPPTYTVPGPFMDSAKPPAATVNRKGADSLYGVADEIKDVRIGWYFSAIDAYKAGVAANLPIVFVYSEDWCRYCLVLVDRALTCPSVNALAGRAVFAYVDPMADKAADAIARSLDIDAYPTISVIEPDSRMILERMRINGFFNGNDIADFLTKRSQGQGLFSTELPSRTARILAPATSLSKTSVNPADCAAPAPPGL